MSEVRNTDEVVEHQKKSNFTWSLADDSSLRKALHEYQGHCFDRASRLQHEITMVGQKTLELNAELECMNANINYIANVKFMEQRLDDDYNTLTPLGKAVLDNSAGLREDTLTTLTNAIHQGIEDVSSICLALSIIGSSEFYSSISSSELISIERSPQRSTKVSTSSASRSPPRTLIECCGEGRVQVPVLPHGRNVEVQKDADMLPSSLIANFCTKKCTANLDGPAVLRHPPAVHPDQLTRVPLLCTESDEDHVRPFVHTSGIKKKSVNNLNWAGEQGVPTDANLAQERLPTTPDHKRSNTKFGCPPSPEGVSVLIFVVLEVKDTTSTSDSSVLGNNFIDGLSVRESLFESTDAQQQNVDVIIDKLLGNTESSPSVDLKGSSEKISTSMHIAKKYADMFDSDSDDEPLFPLRRSLFNSGVSKGMPRNDVDKAPPVSSVNSLKILAQSTHDRCPDIRTEQNAESIDELEVQTKCVIDTDANFSTSTDVHSGQKNLVTTAAWPLSSITKTRCRGPVRRPSNKIRSSALNDHESSDVLSRTFAAHCEGISEVKKDNSLHQRETISPGIPSLQPVIMSTSMEISKHSSVSYVEQMTKQSSIYLHGGFNFRRERNGNASELVNREAIRAYCSFVSHKDFMDS
ncbi:unnamed protein product [Angiostrongylus costaricensis]|uniref:Shugoshin_C domain-containing protein n=1 Tax=Angiostrongylus costaricensis TaxID=334426 RepID=A0A0R3PWG6_ANGCS|nr:unnamed protein product [Angiostrongylus costaricensis]